MHCFQLLHLSDLHIAVRPRVLGFPDRRHQRQFPQGNRGWHHPSSYDPRLAEAVARYAWQNRVRFDAMLLSGDLAATGRKSDLGLARLHVAEPATNASTWLTAQGWPTLAAAELPIFLMPGNHDRYRRILHRPGAKIFDRTFNQSWDPPQRSPTATSGCVQSYPTLRVPTGEMVTFIAADFCLKKGRDATRGWPGRWGQGKAYQDVVDDLIAETDRQRRKFPHTVVMWMIHFAPQSPNVPNDPDLALVDERIFAAAAATAGIKHIFCGHTHVADGPYLLADTHTQVYCTGTAMQYCAPAGNVMHRLEICIDGAGGEARVNWTPIVWNQSASEFS